jgi:N4-gp56 family major capsid protein
MGATNFAGLLSKQKTVWARDVWSAARDQMFCKRFTGTSENSMIQLITDLTKTEKGEKVLMQLVADLVEDGTTGDNEREGFEESMQTYSIELPIDLIAHQVKNKGKLADQKTVINFRKMAKSRLSYWLANRIDQMVFLALSGMSFAYNNDGSARTGAQFASLSFAPHPTNDLPTPKRVVTWTGTALSSNGNLTSSLSTSSIPKYSMIVDAIAYAKDHYIKPLNEGGKEYYVMLVRPGTLAHLKKDADYQRAITSGMERGKNNPFFTGATVTIDGAVIHEHRLVTSTLGMAAGYKWGAGADGSRNVEGSRTLLCGAQALGMADLGDPDWVEKGFQYDSQQGISIDKMFGLLKPKFYSIYDKSVQDFGTLCIDHAL